MLTTWSTRVAAALLLMLAVWAFSYRLGATPLLDDPNEGEYAEVAREMVESGDWLSPQLNYVLFLNKPPLSYWAIGAAYVGFGVNEFAARLPSAVAGVVVVLLLAWLGARLYDVETGLLAGFILLATGGFFVETHEVRPDLLMTAALVGTFVALSAILAPGSKPASRWSWIGLQICVAVGLLAKGMLAVLFPGLVCVVLIVWMRRAELFVQFLHPRAWWLLVVLMVPWHAVMSIKHPGFLWDYVINQHILFFFDRKFPRDSVPVSLPAFWEAFALRLFPWTMFVPLALLRVGRGVRSGAHAFGDRLVLAWIAAVLLFFSAASSRMEHYSIPALPVAALLLARLFREYARGVSTRVVTLHIVGFAVLALGGPFVVPRIVAAQDWLTPVHELPALAQWTFTILAVGAVGAAAAAVAGRRAWVVPVLVGTFAVEVPLFQHGMTAMAQVNSSAGIAATIRAVVEVDDHIVYEAPVEYQNCAAFNFYLRRRLDLLRPADFVAPPYLEPYVADLFLDRDELTQLWQDDRVLFISDPLQSRATLDGIVPAPRYIVVRAGGRWVVTNLPFH